jgi:hypothetical protein
MSAMPPTVSRTARAPRSAVARVCTDALATPSALFATRSTSAAICAAVADTDWIWRACSDAPRAMPSTARPSWLTASFEV